MRSVHRTDRLWSDLLLQWQVVWEQTSAPPGSMFHQIHPMAPPAVLTDDIGQVNAYQLIRTPGFPVIKIGRAYRIPRASFYDWLSRQHCVAAEE